MTNADKLRQMTDEELAKFLCHLKESNYGCDNCPAFDLCLDRIGFVDWLKQGVEE